MTTRSILDPSRVSLATLTPTTRQRRLSFAAIAALLIATAIIVPFGRMQLPSLEGFIPATEAVLVICDLVIAALLASQAMTIGSRALLLLAGGFLFDALIILPHFLTFPGAFAPNGLLGAGLQTTAWLFIFWHFGLPAAVIGYVYLPRTPHTLTVASVGRDAGLIVTAVVLLTWVATAHGDALPALFVDKRGFTPLASTVTGFDFLVSVAALLALAARREKSVFDLWLTVAVVALVAELAVTTFVMTGRFCLAFYASRLLSVAASTIVLIALLAETIRQGTRLARANLALRLERSRKLTSLDAAVGAIVHEVKQPISSIAFNAEAAQLILAGPAPDLDELREITGEIVTHSFRANEIVKGIRELFKGSRQDMQQVDMNDVVTGVLDGLRADMADYSVIPQVELKTDLPAVLGHKGQLQEVVFNLVHNAIDAMKGASTASRTLTIRTEKSNGKAIGISVQDSGPGIAPDLMDQIFDPFVTTKKNGMGMGLAICRLIIERHGGRLSASSAAASGARFEIVLPIDPSPDPQQRPADKAAAVVSARPSRLRRAKAIGAAAARESA